MCSNQRLWQEKSMHTVKRGDYTYKMSMRQEHKSTTSMKYFMYKLTNLESLAANTSSGSFSVTKT